MTFWQWVLYGDPGSAFWLLCLVFGVGGLASAAHEVRERRRRRGKTER